MLNLLWLILYLIIFLGIIISVIQFSIQFLLKRKSILEEEAPIKEVVRLSIHIPTRAEPFEVVKECIDSVLLEIESTDEIIIIDNNHSSLEDYQALQVYCLDVGVRFIHEDYIKGYKAGALNVALDITSDQASHIFVIDCDYVLNNQVLNHVKKLLQLYSKFSYLQFPQAYFVSNKEDVRCELNKYFDYNLNLPRNKVSALGTGSFCLIKKETLKNIGGWPTNSITEDAQMGVNVQRVGGRGLYIPTVIGKGIMPQSLKDFIKQRKRWTYGNAQVFVNLFHRSGNNVLSLSNIYQLTTWMNFTAATLIAHILILLLSLFSVLSIELLALVYIHYTLIVVFKLYEFLQLKHSITKNIRAFLIHWNFFWISSLHWIPVLWKMEREFIRTPKIKIAKSSLFNLPTNFMLLNLLTILCFHKIPSILTFCIVFLILDLLSKILLIKNYKI